MYKKQTGIFVFFVMHMLVFCCLFGKCSEIWSQILQCLSGSFFKCFWGRQINQKLSLRAKKYLEIVADSFFYLQNDNWMMDWVGLDCLLNSRLSFSKCQPSILSTFLNFFLFPLNCISRLFISHTQNTQSKKNVFM